MTVNERATGAMVKSYESSEITTFSSSIKLPDKAEIISILDEIQSLFFPAYFANPNGTSEDFAGEKISSISFRIKKQIKLALLSKGAENASEEAKRITDEFVLGLPRVHELLIKDVIATYEGDPAARSPEEIILSYPGFYAISIYRIAHEFYKKGVPYIPRLMTEFAHEKTGIDIHAGATIGEYFFIDHGTGIVIGETTTIGDRVKIYQGVTLGAKSFELGDDGNPIKGIKRHPDIGNDCVIYANATILGGNTKIGDGSIIGGNVWLTRSVPAGETVYYTGK